MSTSFVSQISMHRQHQHTTATCAMHIKLPEEKEKEKNTEFLDTKLQVDCFLF